MSYQTDLVDKLNNVNVNTASTDDLYVLTKAFFESPIGLEYIPKTFVKNLKSRLLNAGTTAPRDIGLLQKSINYLNFAAFRVASTNTFTPSVNAIISPALDDTDLDYPIFTAVYAPRLPDGMLMRTVNIPSNTNTTIGNTVRLAPAYPGTTLFSTSNRQNRFQSEIPFQLGDKLTISFNGTRASIGTTNNLPDANSGYNAQNGPNPTTSDNFYTVLSRSSAPNSFDVSLAYGKDWIVVQDNAKVSSTNANAYAYVLPVYNFLKDNAAYFSKFGVPKVFRVRMWGAGGGGGANASYGGVPGGGGAYTEAYVTYGDIVKNPWVCAGAGGCPADTTSPPGDCGGDGQASRFAGIVANGGFGGKGYALGGYGGAAQPIGGPILFSASGGYCSSAGRGTDAYKGGSSAGGPWGPGFAGATSASPCGGAGIAGSGFGVAGGSGVVNISGWYTPALSGWVGAQTISGVNQGGGAGGAANAGYYSGGFFGGGAAGNFSNPFNAEGYGTFGGGGAGAGGGYAAGGFGGNGVVIIEWF